MAQEETGATRTSLLTFDPMAGAGGCSHPQKSKTFHRGVLEACPGKVCLKMKLGLNTDKLYSTITVCQTLSGAFNAQYPIKSHNNLKRPLVTTFILNMGGTERVSKFSNVTQLALGVSQDLNPGKLEKAKFLRRSRTLTQRGRRGNSLELSIKACFDKEQEEVKRVRSRDRGNIGAHARPHTMGVWRAQTCQVSCRDEGRQQ